MIDNDILEDMEDVIEMRTSNFQTEKESNNNQVENFCDENLVKPNSRTCEMDTISLSNVFVTNTSYIDTGSVNPLSALCLAMEQTIVQSSCEVLEERTTTDEADDYQRKNNSISEGIQGNHARSSKVTVTHLREPINEFSSNAALLLHAKPMSIYARERNYK